MLRIAKTSPGVLDLSAVNDEFGLPVVLNGPSHRDIPDHEGSNPVLQRVEAAQWVTVTKLPVNQDVIAGNDPAKNDLVEGVSSSETLPAEQPNASSDSSTPPNDEPDGESSAPPELSHVAPKAEESKSNKSKAGRRF